MSKFSACTNYRRHLRGHKTHLNVPDAVVYRRVFRHIEEVLGKSEVGCVVVHVQYAQRHRGCAGAPLCCVDLTRNDLGDKNYTAIILSLIHI